MVNQKQEKIDLPLAMILFVGVGSLAWFLLLPGEVTDKWQNLSTFVDKNADEIALAFVTVLVNAALIIGYLISLTGVGRLGQKINGYYSKKQKFGRFYGFGLCWCLLFVGVYVFSSSLGLEIGFTPFQSLRQSKLPAPIFSVIYLSQLSLLAFSGSLLVSLFKTLSKYSDNGGLPKIQNNSNLLILGSANER